MQELSAQFKKEDGWSCHKMQNKATITKYLQQCENDPARKDRALKLKVLLSEKVSDTTALAHVDGSDTKVTLAVLNSAVTLTLP